MTLPSDQVLVLSSALPVLQDSFHFELHISIDVFGRDVCSKSIVPVWPQQAHVEDIMDVAKWLAVASSGQVQLVSHFTNLLQHLEGSYEVVL